jgi:signal transduction histidine kinase
MGLADAVRRMGATRVDQLLAAVLFVLAELQCLLAADALSRGRSGALMLVATAAVTLGVGVRRRWPGPVGIGTQALLVATGWFVSLPPGPVSVAWFCSLYALAVWTTTPWFVVGVAFFAGSSVLPDLDGDWSGAPVLFAVGGVAVMLLLRNVVGGRDRMLRLAEREREVAAREAVVEERARIARELHDVIAHHVSTMVVQAGAERRVLGPDQDETREVLGTIERMGRGALSEMRRMVAMLRQDPGVDLVPQPQLADVPVLVEQLQAAGMPVRLSVTGQVRELPVGIELSSYRIVQEALTNALKHAGNASAAVTLAYGDDTLEIVVTDDGPGPLPGESGGHGLVGMRERVTMYGGQLQAGRGQDGGFAVRVQLPVR